VAGATGRPDHPGHTGLSYWTGPGLKGMPQDGRNRCRVQCIGAVASFRPSRDSDGNLVVCMNEFCRDDPGIEGEEAAA